ncbi:hypothetical protein OIE49_28790 [Streptomyces sp. NBC_01788]|uniref:hypothetical protein n=1 Tax=Streptomyces sp. NBC_01788 TaxID=2975940 RepID=UPI002DDB76EC|nr:hypothetical protein [Streptomyces sp. NBC_01788]WSB29570.1 hypothetical protein OIE49_28790 [Streptomyces sp. NBC_01788]
MKRLPGFWFRGWSARARNGSGPSRNRARPIAAVVGTRQVVAHRPSRSRLYNLTLTG